MGRVCYYAWSAYAAINASSFFFFFSFLKYPFAEQVPLCSLLWVKPSTTPIPANTHWLWVLQWNLIRAEINSLPWEVNVSLRQSSNFVWVIAASPSVSKTIKSWLNQSVTSRAITFSSCAVPRSALLALLPARNPPAPLFPRILIQRNPMAQVLRGFLFTTGLKNIASGGTCLILWTNWRRAENGVIFHADRDKQGRLGCAHAEEHKQEEKKRYHRNEGLPVPTSFVTSASLPPSITPALDTATEVMVPLGVQVFLCPKLLPAAMRENWYWTLIKVGKVLVRRPKKYLQCHPGNRAVPGMTASPASFPRARGWRGTVGYLQINTLSGSQPLLIPSSVSASHVSGLVPAYNLAENLPLEWDYNTVMSKATSFMGDTQKGWGCCCPGRCKASPLCSPKRSSLIKSNNTGGVS